MRLPLVVTRAQPETNERRFYGWRIVGAAFVLAVFGWGLGFYGPPVYLHAIQATRGWTVALISTAITVHFLIGALVVASLPMLYRRLGVPVITKLGAVSIAIGITGWALAREPYQLFLATLFSGAGWAAMGAAAVNAIIAPWFMRTRPAALSMAYNGSSAGGVVFSPLWVAAIACLGFPMAAALIGVATIVTIWILADAFFAKSPGQLRLGPDGDPVQRPPTSPQPSTPALPGRALWSNMKFLTLAAGMAAGLFAQIGLLAHLFSLLVPSLGEALAGLAMSGATAAAIVGRTLVGWLMPASADRRLIACASYGVQVAGSVAFLVAEGSNGPLLLIGVLLFGVGIGNATSLPPLIAQAEFAQDDVARVVPLIIAIAQGSFAFAPAAFGLIRQFTDQAPGLAAGAAPHVFVAAALIQVVAILLLLLGRSR
jgi:Major Facilitator Superfamily